MSMGDFEEDIYAITWTDHNYKLMSFINKDCLKDESLCDVSLVCSNEEEFKGHRLILSYASPTLKNLFKKSLVLVFAQTKPRIMKLILQYVYEGSVDVHRDDLQELLAFSKFLKLPEIGVDEEKTNDVQPETTKKDAEVKSNTKRSQDAPGSSNPVKKMKVAPKPTELTRKRPVEPMAAPSDNIAAPRNVAQRSISFTSSTSAEDEIILDGDDPEFIEDDTQSNRFNQMKVSVSISPAPRGRSSSPEIVANVKPLGQMTTSVSNEPPRILKSLPPGIISSSRKRSPSPQVHQRQRRSPSPQFIANVQPHRQPSPQPRKKSPSPQVAGNTQSQRQPPSQPRRHSPSPQIIPNPQEHRREVPSDSAQMGNRPRPINQPSGTPSPQNRMVNRPVRAPASPSPGRTIALSHSSLKGISVTRVPSAPRNPTPYPGGSDRAVPSSPSSSPQSTSLQMTSPMSASPQQAIPASTSVTPSSVSTSRPQNLPKPQPSSRPPNTSTAFRTHPATSMALPGVTITSSRSQESRPGSSNSQRPPPKEEESAAKRQLSVRKDLLIERAPPRQGTCYRGKLAWKKKVDNRIQEVEFPCAMSCTLLNGQPEIISDQWPSVLQMNIVPSEVLNNIGQEYIQDSQKVTVTLPPDADTAAQELAMLLANGNQGVIQLHGRSINAVEEMCFMVLVYSLESQQFEGYIPIQKQEFIYRFLEEMKRIKQSKMAGEGASSGNK